MQLLRTRPRFLLAAAAVATVTTVLTLGEPISAWQSNFMGGAPTRGDDGGRHGAPTAARGAAAAPAAQSGTRPAVGTRG